MATKKYQADITVKPDFEDQRFVIVTANTEHAEKWLGRKTSAFEVPEWKIAEKDAKQTGFIVKRTI